MLGVAAGLLGVGFKTFLYWFEDYLDRMWKGRPEWARPAVGGIVLGVLLLALPQMYGVGYPVMDNIVAGHEALWLIVILMVGKVVASSLTLSIGGSGGVFAPSLFTGAAGGMAFGVTARHIFGTDIGPAAMYAVIAMGGVFAGATQAPLTAIASVLEMTGNFSLTLPVMLAFGIASATGKQLIYGYIYTTKLLRRGIDIEQPKATSALAALTIAEVMQPAADGDARTRLLAPTELEAEPAAVSRELLTTLVGPVSEIHDPQVLFGDEDLEHALRHAAKDPHKQVHIPTTPLDGYEILEITISPQATACGRRLGDMRWPAGARVLAASEGHKLVAPRTDVELRPGERVVLLAPVAGSDDGTQPARKVAAKR